MNLDRLLPTIDVVRMQQSHVTVVGGAYGLTQDLVRCGLGSITYIDFDRVDASNPARQDLNSTDVGMHKVEALSPVQMRRLGPAFDRLRGASDEHVNVTPDEPIVVDGQVRHGEKRFAARFVSTVLQHLDKTDAGGAKEKLNPENIPPDAMPLRLGHRMDETGRIIGAAIFPLAEMLHTYISGTTGSGKSFLLRVLVEEAFKHEKLKILILDPRNQSVGLLLPEDRAQVLDRYAQFEMKPGQAQGFQFDYFAPGFAFTPPLPKNLSSLSAGRSIVSLKGLDDEQRCSMAARILNTVFDACAEGESEYPQLLILVDEAQLFTRKRVDPSAAETAAGVERAIDRIAREGRKFGIVPVLVTQTIKDFSYDLASVRQMMNTKIFLRNSDREIDYAADILGDGRILVQLPTGTAVVHNANWGTIRVSVRPPYSKVFEPVDAEVKRLFEGAAPAVHSVSADAQRLLAIVREHGSPPNTPLNMSTAAELAGITSKRHLLKTIEELEQAGAIRTRRLPERGQPRAIEPIIK